ncbi:alpha-1,3/1,6-mannosyltransferase ALG2 [Cimex lectularius]|uniref:Alpha-1,3/1,6-mannosyltransferase ALG2 n=1 Tax=Cimex lectularius TaxID=79782 RepID=A0A8I6RA92_CIMLE|nr:alpha-1,3/1,6-mannosyltransferase ALG2 [Cimex lectularius]
MSKGNIVFLHPDLGVGGAERLVVDAAIALKNSGYDVKFVTSHHNSEHCFPETKDGTLPVEVIGGWIPRNVFGRLFALLSCLKMIYCAFYVIFKLKPDLVFCDLVSACIPVLKMGVKKVVFYCHYPDQLLSMPEGLLKSLYRYPLDWLEEKTTVMADKLYVNSKFTQDVFCTTFRRNMTVVPDILYPSINTVAFDRHTEIKPEHSFKDEFVILSINRYEAKKNIEIAILALRQLRNELDDDRWDRVKLIIAGGYDPKVHENIEYFEALVKLAKDTGLSEKIIFLKSPSEESKISLIRRCDCLIYTPPNEHFGIVPLEAMYAKKPVIASNSGGPTETVLNNKTGFLCEDSSTSFAKALYKLITEENLKEEMGRAGFKRFLEKFSFSSFSNHLNNDIEDLVATKNN